MAIRRDVIPAALSRSFMSYGRFVSRYPWPFIVTPPLVATGLALGLIFMTVTTDIEYLYIPKNADAFEERALVERRFPIDDKDNFNSVRSTRDQGYVQVIIKNKHGENVFNQAGLAVAFEIDDIVNTLNVKYKDVKLRYSDICAAWQGKCEKSTLLQFMDGKNFSETSLTFPVHRTERERLYLTYQLGGVRVDSETDIVESARAIMLSYYTRYEAERDRKRSTEWLNSIRDRLFKYKSKTASIYLRTSLSFEQEFDESVVEVINLFIITFGLLSVFGVLSMLMRDWVRAKPWVAAGALFAAAMASGSALGLLTGAGVPFTSPVGIAPFLIIGIGLDDVYIMVSSWRHQTYTLPTGDRVAFMLKDAAVSITITSVTDALAFGIGLTSSFRSVQIFCAYVMAGVIFCYFYQLTFTVACIVLSGRREGANRHCLTFQRVLPKAESGEKSVWYRLFCSGGVSQYKREEASGSSVESETQISNSCSCSTGDNDSDTSYAYAETSNSMYKYEEQRVANTYGCKEKKSASIFAYQHSNCDTCYISNSAMDSKEKRTSDTTGCSANTTVIILDQSNEEPQIIHAKRSFDTQKGYRLCYGNEVHLADEVIPNPYHTRVNAGSANVNQSNMTKHLPAETLPRYQMNSPESTFQDVTPVSPHIGHKYSHSRNVTPEFQHSTQNDTAKPRKNTKNKRHENNAIDGAIHLPWLNQFLATQFATCLMKPVSRVLVILAYIAYIGVSIYAIFRLKEGLKLEHLVPDTSYVAEFISEYHEQFSSHYGTFVQIIYDEPIDYQSSAATKDIEFILESYRRNEYYFASKQFTLSWLHDYEQYLSMTSRSMDDLSTEQFIGILKNEFLTIPGFDVYSSDLVFASNFTSIKASRMFVQSKGASDAIAQREMMLASRQIVDGSHYDVTSFALTFPFYDMYVVIVPVTLQSLGLAVVSMFVVSLILIPSITTVILVTLATISIEIGVIGFMSLWGVYLDAVSMINLIMCIGFSVDFAAHISYHYVISGNRDPVQNARDALGHLGVPIILAALSTILAVVILSISVSYVFRTFFKIVTLIMLFGFFHAMFLLPVLLSTVKEITRGTRKVFVEKASQTELYGDYSATG